MDYDEILQSLRLKKKPIDYTNDVQDIMGPENPVATAARRQRLLDSFKPSVPNPNAPRYTNAELARGLAAQGASQFRGADGGFTTSGNTEAEWRANPLSNPWSAESRAEIQRILKTPPVDLRPAQKQISREKELANQISQARMLRDIANEIRE